MCTVSPQQNLCFKSFLMFIHANIESKRSKVRVCERELVRFSYLFISSYFYPGHLPFLIHFS